MQDNDLVRKVQKIINGEIRENVMITQDGMLVMKHGICVPNVNDLRKAIMEEAHCSAYIMHLGSIKIYRIIKKNYWWLGIKRDIVEFVSRCLVCQQLKVGTHHHGLRCQFTSHSDRP